MILDLLDHAEIYAPTGSRLSLGFAWLRNFSPAMPDGRYPINGDDIFALVQSYETAEPAQKTFESHRNYLDIQYVAVGCEVMQHASVTTLQPETEYHPESDYTLYHEPHDATTLKVAAGSFAVFYPSDGHKPGCLNIHPERVSKAVIKIRLV